ncbi:hypothetical protein ABZ079_03110 [Streptomyces sp. NPDC006314]|uniref:hypothetical protein n=1 Tax=Streptomyces sp. NPDC006314 TaxID=3154475 RepID=UPI0033B875E3
MPAKTAQHPGDRAEAGQPPAETVEPRAETAGPIGPVGGIGPTVHITVGARLPAAATPLGRVLPADTAEPPSPALAEVRTQGYGLVDAGQVSGPRSIAVPVRVAAVNLATVEDCVHHPLPGPRASADRIQDDLRTASLFTPIPLL